MRGSFDRGEEDYGLLDSIVEQSKIFLSETRIEISVAIKNTHIYGDEVARCLYRLRTRRGRLLCSGIFRNDQRKDQQGKYKRPRRFETTWPVRDRHRGDQFPGGALAGAEGAGPVLFGVLR